MLRFLERLYKNTAAISFWDAPFPKMLCKNTVTKQSVKNLNTAVHILLQITRESRCPANAYQVIGLCLQQKKKKKVLKIEDKHTRCHLQNYFPFFIRSFINDIHVKRCFNSALYRKRLTIFMTNIKTQQAVESICLVLG